MFTLFLTFLKLGAFIFGSGHALAAAMQNEIVEKQKWMSAEQFQNGWAAGNILPGPIATKVAAYVGYQQGGTLGAVLATAAYLLPSIGGMILVTVLLSNQAVVNAPLMKSLLRGIKPAVLALLVDAFLSFTGVSVPKGSAFLAYGLPCLLILAGIVVSLSGVWWLSRAGGAEFGRYLLADFRAIVIFALALGALLVFHLDTVYVTLGAAALGLTYLLF